jgi:Glycosyltransferase
MYASATLWLVPSRWAEPFGRVSIEAQGSKRAVLVASTGGLVETVQDLSFCIDGLDAKLWLARIRSSLGIEPYVLENNGAQVRERFSDSAHDARWFEVLEKILSEDANTPCVLQNY